MTKKIIRKPMYELLCQIELKTRKNVTDICKILDMSRQNYYRLKKNQQKQVQLLVELKEKFNLSWSDIGEWLEKDYGKGKK